MPHCPWVVRSICDDIFKHEGATYAWRAIHLSLVEFSVFSDGINIQSYSVWRSLLSGILKLPRSRCDRKMTLRYSWGLEYTLHPRSTGCSKIETHHTFEIIRCVVSSVTDRVIILRDGESVISWSNSPNLWSNTTRHGWTVEFDPRKLRWWYDESCSNSTQLPPLSVRSSFMPERRGKVGACSPLA